MIPVKHNQSGISTWTERLAHIVASNKVLSKLAYNILVEEDLNDAEIEAMRRGKCKGCENNDGVICRGCGCVLEIKIPAKTNINIHTGKIEVTHCPEGFWNDENLMVYYKTNN